MKKAIVTISVLALIGVAVPLWACSVPVFRYALERWQADPYEVLVFHRGPMTADQQAVADSLSGDGQAGKIHANLRTTLVDLDADPDPQLLEIWKSQETEALPWMTVRYPLATRIPVDAVSGPLTKQNVQSLLDSPARREIARSLLSGKTAVFVVLESGEREKDAAATKLVEEQSQSLGSKLKLPEIADEDLDEVSVDPTALKLDFSTIHVSRNDPAERMFVEMLLGSEEDLRDLDEPMVFPVFGRGRALYALIGGGITPDNIHQAGVDLTGPCTCTVKDQNPGVDLVMAVDWDNLVEAEVEIDKELPPLTGLGSFAANIAESSDAPTPKDTTGNEPTSASGEPQPSSPADTPKGDSPTAATESAASPLMRNVLLIGGMALFAVIAGSLLLFRKQA